MANPAPSPNPDPPEKKSFKDSFKSSLSDFRSNAKLSNVMSYAAANTRDTISYVILIIGIVLLFFHSFYGGMLIGLVTGFYFSSEILALLHHTTLLVDEQGIVKSLVAGGLILGLFISAPAIFIGMALAVAIRQLLFPEKSK
jgi:hypothetical protein